MYSLSQLYYCPFQGGDCLRPGFENVQNVKARSRKARSQTAPTVEGFMNTKLCLTVLAALLMVSLRAPAQSKLNVVTTTEDLASIACEVGGDRITVEWIARGY